MDKPLDNLLKQLPVFKKLGERELADVKRLAIFRNYGSGEMLAVQGDIWPFVLILTRGEISVQKLSPEGRSLGAWRVSSGEVFWSPSMFDDGPLPASLEAREPCEVLIWARDQIMPIVQQNQDAMWSLCQVLVQRIRQASEVVEDLAFQPVTSRLARLLIKEYEEAADPHVTRSLTLDEMATIIGTTPVMVCKVLSRFADQGMIKVSRTEFEFVDRGKLHHIAGL